jgi:hypothetical protein
MTVRTLGMVLGIKASSCYGLAKSLKELHQFALPSLPATSHASTNCVKAVDALVYVRSRNRKQTQEGLSADEMIEKALQLYPYA